MFTDRPGEVSVTWMYNRETVDWHRDARGMNLLVRDTDNTAIGHLKHAPDKNQPFVHRAIKGVVRGRPVIVAETGMKLPV